MTNTLNQAKELLLSQENVVCVVISKDNNVFHASDRGIKPLVDWLRTNPTLLNQAVIADKVIGKAAAMLMVYGGVKEVYGGIISDSAANFFEQEKVPFYFEKQVPYIINRNKTGMCPMEERAQSLNSAKEAFEIFSEIVK